MEFVRLNYYHIMIFLYEINELRVENELFKDRLIEAFEDDFLTRTCEIVKDYGFLNEMILKNLRLYSLSKSLYDYLIQITSINPLEPKVMRFYKPRIKAMDSKILSGMNFLSDDTLKKIDEEVEVRYSKNKRK